MLVVQDTDLETVKTVFSNKTLFDASMPDEDRLQRDLGLWEPDPHEIWNFLEITDGAKVYGIIRYQPISSVAIDCHIHLLPEYWGKKASSETATAFEHYVQTYTKFHKLQVQCPRSCEHSIRYVAKHGFEIEGMLIGAAYWNGKIEDLVILGKLIRRPYNG